MSDKTPKPAKAVKQRPPKPDRTKLDTTNLKAAKTDKATIGELRAMVLTLVDMVTALDLRVDDLVPDVDGAVDDRVVLARLRDVALRIGLTK